MAENTAIDTVQDDDLLDEALDRSNGGKWGTHNSGCGCVVSRLDRS